MTNQFNRINAQDMRIGMSFSAPVFFDDGENMFLAEEKTIKPYHLAAIARWNIRYLFSYGHLLDESAVAKLQDYDCELEEIEEAEPV